MANGKRHVFGKSISVTAQKTRCEHRHTVRDTYGIKTNMVVNATISL